MTNSSKRFLRRELRRKTEEFLSDGGEIKCYSQGETNRSDNKSKGRPPPMNLSPRQPRTCVNDVVVAIDNRKKREKCDRPKRTSGSLKKKVIYDDFGEPLREVWVEK